MKRGEVWWADLDPPSGRRPVVLLSRDESYELRHRATIAEVSTRVRGIPVEVELGPEDGLPRRCAANLDNINTVETALLRERVGQLGPSKVRAINMALKFALDIPSEEIL